MFILPDEIVSLGKWWKPGDWRTKDRLMLGWWLYLGLARLALNSYHLKFLSMLLKRCFTWPGFIFSAAIQPIKCGDHLSSRCWRHASEVPTSIHCISRTYNSKDFFFRHGSHSILFRDSLSPPVLINLAYFKYRGCFSLKLIQLIYIFKSASLN